MAFILGARLSNTFRKRCQDVVFLNDLRRVFDIPAGAAKLFIN